MNVGPDTGPRAGLRPLFELADDSAQQRDGVWALRATPHRPRCRPVPHTGDRPGCRAVAG
jgi:hypothetical protein